MGRKSKLMVCLLNNKHGRGNQSDCYALSFYKYEHLNSNRCGFGGVVFKFYSAFVACRLLLLFNSPNCRKISVLIALLSDNSSFLLCFGIVSRSLTFLIFSAFLIAFCRDFVDDKLFI